MATEFLTGTQNLGTEQPGSPSVQSIPSLDGTQQGMTDTVNALVNTVRALAGHQPAPNNKSQPGTKNDQQKKKNNRARFSELSRTTQTVKISNPDDPTQFVMVKQITKLVMQDNVTKETWEWT